MAELTKERWVERHRGASAPVAEESDDERGGIARVDLAVGTTAEFPRFEQVLACRIRPGDPYRECEGKEDSHGPNGNLRP